MAVNPVNRWVTLGYQFYLGVQYLPSTGFVGVIPDNFDGSGLAFTRDGQKLYASQGLPAHVAAYELTTASGVTEWRRRTVISGSPDLFNEHILSITMN